RPPACRGRAPTAVTDPHILPAPAPVGTSGRDRGGSRAALFGGGRDSVPIVRRQSGELYTAPVRWLPGNAVPRVADRPARSGLPASTRYSGPRGRPAMREPGRKAGRWSP